MRLAASAGLVVVAMIAALCSVVSAIPQSKAGGSTDPLSGEWDATFYAMGHTAPFTLEIQVSGEKVNGKINSAHTGPGTISDGSWAEEKLTFVAKFEAHDSIAFTGSLQDGKLMGEFRTEGFVAKWEAKKK